MSAKLTIFKDAAAWIQGGFRQPAPPFNQEESIFRRELQAAMDDWHHAENHFREATDEDLIDKAAYDLLSAKSRYTYLLKQARNRGISL